MAMRVRIVCPETSAFDGEAVYLTIPSSDGILGVAQRHASEICTIEPGYIRICFEAIGSVSKTFAVDGGYAQITGDEVVVLADRAADLATVDHEKVQAKIQGFEESLLNLSKDDAHRSYLYNEIAWCKLLLAN